MLVLTWLRMQACTLLPWHSLGPCWQVKSQPPSSVSVNWKHFKLIHYVFSLGYNSDISFSEGFENNFKFLGSKYLEGGMKLVCHEARKGKSEAQLQAECRGCGSPLAVPAQALVVHGQLDRGASRSGPPQPVDWPMGHLPNYNIIKSYHYHNRTIFTHLFLYLYLESQNCEYK